MSDLGFSFDPRDPTLGTDLSLGDVEQLFSSYLEEQANPETATEINLDTAVALGGFLDLHAALSSAQLEDQIDEAVAGEQLRKGLSEVLLGALGELSIGAPKGQLRKIRELGANLKKHKKTPFAITKKERDELLGIEERASKVKELNDRIAEIENENYGFTGRSLKEKKYTVDNVSRDGKWLKRVVGEVEGESGSGKALFREEEAHVLAGLSLSLTTEDFIKHIWVTYGEIKGLRREIIQNKGEMTVVGFFSALSKLKEAYESGHRLFTSNDANFKPLKRLADILYASEEVIQEGGKDTLKEGPFKRAEVVEIAPWSTERGVTSTVIIDQFVDEKSIKEDMDAAIKGCGNKYSSSEVVEQKRIDDFIELRRILLKKYGEANVRTLRTFRSRWHPLPWYAIEVSVGGRVLVAMESPIHGNASYFFDSENGSDWLEVICGSRKSAREEHGATAEWHRYDDDRVLRGHVQKMLKHFEGKI